jgi:hypothetical protein
MIQDRNSNRNLQSLVSRNEYRFVFLVSILALAITSIPYIIGAMTATDDRVFGGFVIAVEDCYTYLAKMRLGAKGAWLFHVSYTSEPHMGTFLYLFYLLLGKIAALLPGADLTARMVWTYHAARWVFGLGLLLTVYRFLAEFVERVIVRRISWLMVTFGGGLGWLIVALGESRWLGSEPLDFILPEGFTFLVLFTFPHLALGRTLLLWGILFLLRAWLPGKIQNTQYAIRISHSALAGVLWFLMGLIVPFYVAVAWAVMGAAWLVLCVRRRSVMWREVLLAGVSVLVSAPILAYSMWVFASDPVYEAWAAQNLILSPHPLHYLAAYGVLFLLASFALRDAWRSTKPVWLPLAWIGVVPFLIYLPFNAQRRLIEGVQVPLSLLAAWGLVRISNLKSHVSGARRWLIVSVVLVVISLTNLLIVAGSSLMLQGQPVQIYRDVAETRAMDWLAERVAPEDVVLAAYAPQARPPATAGNYLPARVGARVFVGHGPETVHVEEKQAQMLRFFDASAGDAWRQDLIAEHSIDYVFWGPAERQMGDFDPRDVSYLRAVYDADGYVIFEVVQ